MFKETIDLYRRKKFKKPKKEYDSDEGSIFLGVEAHPKYENVQPGTVTVEGFGLECWEYEETFGKHRENTFSVCYAAMPSVPAKKLLRRLDELRHGGPKLGWNPKLDDARLREFTGNMGYEMS